MTNEENYMNSRMKRENPFRVPEGYFDQLAEQIIASLPEEKCVPLTEQPESVQAVTAADKGNVATVRRLRPWMLAAACFAGVILLGSVYFTQSDRQTEQAVASAAVSDNYSYVDEAFDYAMVDNQDIYACLSGDF